MSAFRAALVALSAAVLTAACAAGQHAATANERPTLDGTQGRIGSIQLEGVVLASPPGTSYATGADVPLTVYIANAGHTADTLTKVSSPAFTGGWDILATSDARAAQAAQATASPDPFASTSPAAPSNGSPQQIGPGAALPLGVQNVDSGNGASPRTLVLKGLADKVSPLFPGTTIKVTFTFAKAGDTTLNVPVAISAKPNTQTLPVSYSPPA